MIRVKWIPQNWENRSRYVRESLKYAGLFSPLIGLPILTVLSLLLSSENARTMPLPNYVPIEGTAIQNSNFETASLESWEVIGVEPEITSKESISSNINNFQVQLSVPESSNVGFSGIRQKFRLSNNNIPIRLRFKSENESGGVTLFRLRAYGEDDTYRWNDGTLNWEREKTLPSEQKSNSSFQEDLYTLRLSQTNLQDIRFFAEALSNVTEYEIEFLQVINGKSSWIDEVVVDGPRKSLLPVMYWEPPTGGYSSDFPSINNEDPKLTDRTVLVGRHHPEDARPAIAKQNLEEHLPLMAELGVDVIYFTINLRGSKHGKTALGPNSIMEAALFQALFEQIQEVAPHMRVVGMIDRGTLKKTERPNVSVDDPSELASGIKNYVNYWANESPYRDLFFRIDGKPVVMNFRLNSRFTVDEISETNALLDSFVASGEMEDIFFVGGVAENSNGRTALRNKVNIDVMKELVNTFDAIELAPLGGNRNWNETNFQQISEIAQTVSPVKPIMWGVMPAWIRIDKKHRGYIPPTFEYLHNLWMLANQAPSSDLYSILWSWNDVAEDHHLFPSVNHTEALFELQKIYLSWYKSGYTGAYDASMSGPGAYRADTNLPIQDDKIFINFLRSGTGSVAGIGGDWKESHTKLNFWAFVSEPSELIVDFGSQVESHRFDRAGLWLGRFSTPVKIGQPQSYRFHRIDERGQSTDVVYANSFPQDLRRQRVRNASGNPIHHRFNHRWLELHKLPNSGTQ